MILSIFGLRWPQVVSRGLRVGVGMMALGGLVACVPLLDPQVQSQMQRIQVDPIPDREGQYLRTRLRKLMTPEGVEEPLYRLTIQLEKEREVLGISRDATTNRMRVILKATYTLSSLKGNVPPFQGQTKAYTSYSYLEHGFIPNTAADHFSVETGLEILSQHIVTDVAAYLKKQLALVTVPSTVPSANSATRGGARHG